MGYQKQLKFTQSYVNISYKTGIRSFFLQGDGKLPGWFLPVA